MGYTDKDKQRVFQTMWLQKRRKAWIAANGPCVRCRSHNRLEVDHIDPDKKFDHRIWSWSEKRRLEELKKCQILCWKCHKEKTSAQRFSRVKHGTSTMYDGHGCRCDACRAYKSVINKKRYLRV